MEYILDAFGILFYQVYPIIGFYLVISVFIRKSSLLLKFDDKMLKAFKWVKFLFIGLFLIKCCLVFTIDQEVFISMKRQMIGKYWYGYWLEPILLILLSFLLVLKSNRSAIRVITGFSFLITVDSLIIFFSAVHRDYLPSSWGSLFPIGNYFLPALVKTIVLFLSIMFIQDKIKTNDVRN